MLKIWMVALHFKDTESTLIKSFTDTALYTAPCYDVVTALHFKGTESTRQRLKASLCAATDASRQEEAFGQ